jgi:transposase
MRTIGIDVSKATVDLALLDSAQHQLEHARRPNALTDVTAALTWISARTPDLIVLEATGPYHAPLLAALATTELAVALVNPARIKAYRQSQGGRHKTDRADAALLARFARDHAAELRRYVAPPAAQRHLRALVTYRDGLLARRTDVLNQREAAQWQHDAPAVLAWLAADLAELAARLASVERALADAVAALPEAPVLLAMPGVGLHIAAAVLALVPVEVRGDAKAAAAWAGVHPQIEASGQRSHSWLSKHGNARVRRYLYMGALVAVRHDASLAAKYAGLCARGLPKQAALCAIMHSLLRRMMGRLKRFYAGLEPFQA